MLRIAIVFLVIAGIASIFAFRTFTDYSWGWAKVLFFIFLGLAMASWIGGTFRMWSDKGLAVPQKGPTRLP
jgi:uncharacterized membrane protein YtjA (UPF0391 family)